MNQLRAEPVLLKVLVINILWILFLPTITNVSQHVGVKCCLSFFSLYQQALMVVTVWKPSLLVFKYLMFYFFHLKNRFWKGALFPMFIKKLGCVLMLCNHENRFWEKSKNQPSEHLRSIKTSFSRDFYFCE
jgi:hypothetical protein